MLERLQVAHELNVGTVPLRADKLGRPGDKEGGERGAYGRGYDVVLPREAGENQRRRERRPCDGHIEARREAHAQEGRASSHKAGGKEVVGDGLESAAEGSSGEEEWEDETSLVISQKK